MPSSDLRDAADDALRATSENKWPNSTNVNDKALDPAAFEPCLCDLVAPYLAFALATFTILKPCDSAAEFRSVSAGFQDMNPGYRERANLMFVPCVQCPLRRKALFRPFSDAELDFVARMKTDHIVVAPRADIIREDEVGGSVYTLFEGWAVRYHRLPRGGRQILDLVLPGDMIGLASAVLGTVKHSVQAITPVSLCVLESRDFPELFNAHPGFALNILQTRVEEEQRGDVRLSLLGRSRADQRIGYLMLETFDRLRQLGIVDGGSTCPFPLQRRDLADAAGLSRVHVARTLEALRERRLAEIQDGVLVLFNRERLADLAGYFPLRTASGRRAIL